MDFSCPNPQKEPGCELGQSAAGLGAEPPPQGCRRGSGQSQAVPAHPPRVLVAVVRAQSLAQGARNGYGVHWSSAALGGCDRSCGESVPVTH